MIDQQPPLDKELSIQVIGKYRKYRSKLIVVLILLIFFGLVLGVRLFLNRDSKYPPNGEKSTKDENSPKSFIHAVNKYGFTPPEGWEFYDVGLPVEGSTMVATQEEFANVIYLHHPATDAAMDLHTQIGFDRTNLQENELLQYTTSRGYNSLIHIGDCSVFDESRIYLENNGQSLFVEVDELCEEEAWKQADLEPLAKALANSFEFIDE